MRSWGNEAHALWQRGASDEEWDALLAEAVASEDPIAVMVVKGWHSYYGTVTGVAV